MIVVSIQMIIESANFGAQGVPIESKNAGEFCKKLYNRWKELVRINRLQKASYLRDNPFLVH